uniref:Large ribosomal subunit protein bL28m n=1 Tax=Tetraodon nigroviridis TaxID=99883 RepID=H3C9B9_TETNG
MPLHKFPPKLWDALKLKQGHLQPLCASTTSGRAGSTEEPTARIHWQGPPALQRAKDGGSKGTGCRDVPIPIYYPQSQDGLWGGEGWISGYRYANNDKMSTRLKKTWKPQLFKRELYSEILDHKFTITVTARTLDLIDAAYGFDFYILKTPKEDLNSKLGMDLKRAMLLRLARRSTELYPNDPARRDRVYGKYKQFEIPEEEAEWVGLNLEEAVEKQRQLEHKEPQPLFKACVDNLVE